MFRFGDTDTKVASKVLRKQEDVLSKVLRETVPGLVTSSQPGLSENVPTSSLTAIALIEDRAGAAGHHRLLTGADALHVTVLFQPTVTWLHRVHSIFPTTLALPTNESQTLLDEFVVNVYLPQLEEKVQGLFTSMMTSSDAFLEDSGWRALSPTPLVKVILILANEFKFRRVVNVVSFW